MIATGALGAGLGAGAGRSSSLMDLLAPLDYPRQSLWNALYSPFAAAGQGDLSQLLRAVPGLLGGGAGLALGGPGGAVLGAGLGQGLARLTGAKEFDAPSGADVVSGLGGDPESLAGIAGGMGAQIAGDPLSYLGAMLGSGLAKRPGWWPGQGMPERPMTALGTPRVASTEPTFQSLKGPEPLPPPPADLGISARMPIERPTMAALTSAPEPLPPPPADLGISARMPIERPTMAALTSAPEQYRPGVPEVGAFEGTSVPGLSHSQWLMRQAEAPAGGEIGAPLGGVSGAKSTRALKGLATPHDARLYGPTELQPGEAGFTDAMLRDLGGPGGPTYNPDLTIGGPEGLHGAELARLREAFPHLSDEKLMRALPGQDMESLLRHHPGLTPPQVQEITRRMGTAHNMAGRGSPAISTSEELTPHVYQTAMDMVGGNPADIQVLNLLLRNLGEQRAAGLAGDPRLARLSGHLGVLADALPAPLGEGSSQASALLSELHGPVGADISGLASRGVHTGAMLGPREMEALKSLEESITPLDDVHLGHAQAMKYVHQGFRPLELMEHLRPEGAPYLARDVLLDHLREMDEAILAEAHPGQVNTHDMLLQHLLGGRRPLQ